MQSFALDLRPLSAFIRVPESDSLFGQFCWAYRESMGDDKLSSLLDGFCEHPFMVLSGFLPKGYLPRPVLPPFEEFSAKSDEELIDARKKIKKLGFLPEEILAQSAAKLSSKEYQNALWEAIKSAPRLAPTSLVTGKNAIDRATGKVAKGFLYSQDELLWEPDARLRVYFKLDTSRFSSDEARRVFEQIGQTGFGKEKSTGKGQFEVLDLVSDPALLRPLEGANRIISLSNAIACDQVRLFSGKTKVKFPRHGGELAVKGDFRKNPFQYFLPGATFEVSESKDYYGKALDTVSNKPGHLQNTFLLPCFAKWEDRK
jgi:CRISPR-associated protein Csm4